MKTYYIAYGSNLNVEQMRYRCPDASPVGTGKLHGYQLLFRGSGSGYYLTVEPKEGGIVPFVLWEVSGSDLRHLDRYEGYPVFYRREQWWVRYKPFTNAPGNRHLRQAPAFIYLMNPGRKLGMPSDAYMDTCMSGYRHFGFDPEYLHEAFLQSMWG